MLTKENNYAFIDSQNLNLGIQSLGWKLDFKRFRIYLKEKYQISVAYLFIGYIPQNKDLYLSKDKIIFMNKLKSKLEYKKEKAPLKDET
ncbi:MAG: hypothetical protein PHY40_01390 [Patescibacteria group bacterium]|nr:hypothetical protein [Patescibacteria group bacterium]